MVDSVALVIPDEMLVQVIHEKNQFIISHCQQSLPIAYEVTGWLRRAREHASTRVVFQVLSESKRYTCTVCVCVMHVWAQSFPR